MAAPATEVAFSERMAVLEDLAGFIRGRLAEGLKVGRANPGGSPPTFTVARAGGGEPVLSFGLVDTIFFWTFDGGTSCHYSRDRELMFRILTGELAKSRLIGQAPAQGPRPSAQ